MSIEIIKQVERSNPVNQITETELDHLILKMGSFLSIINNKKINPAKLLITIVTDKNFQECFFELSEIDCLRVVIEAIINKYPSLCKSKVVYNALAKKKKTCKRKD